MSDIPDDIFTEPVDVADDTLANLGPLRRLAGIWEGKKGVDLNPKADGPERREFTERIELQPIDAQATVSACVAAYHATGDVFWVAEARRAFEWFLGRNDLGMALYDASTGGCRDGLHVDRLSQNQGAESTLAFLLALAEQRALQNTLASFKEPNSN